MDPNVPPSRWFQGSPWRHTETPASTYNIPTVVESGHESSPLSTLLSIFLFCRTLRDPALGRVRRVSYSTSVRDVCLEGKDL